MRRLPIDLAAAAAAALVAAVAVAAVAVTVLAPPAMAAPHTYTVVIDAMKFEPTPARLRVGDTIVWVNRDMFRHTVTARNGAFDVDLEAGAKRSTVIKAAGKIAFYCRFHPGMTGSLTVTG
jgi:plastocyanin